MHKTIYDISLLYGRKLRETRRNPVFIFMGITMPLLYLGLFAPLLKSLASSKGFPGDNVLNTFVPGMLANIAFNGGIFAGFGIIDELRSGLIERLRVTPTSRFALLAGPVLRDITTALIQVLLFVLIALPFGFRMDIAGLGVLLILLCLLVAITSSFGNAMGLVTKSEDRFAPIVHGINLPTILLSGVLLPMALAPKWLQVMAHFNPIYYVVEASRHLAAGDISHTNVIQAFLMIVPLMLITMAWATRVFSKAVM
jgi:ABC-2 type transport system permease protein